jgi:hypothetical protein
MANYIIIGGDGKEYGPVTDADVRQWLAESRLNAHSLAKAESDAEFRQLGKFPEFAAILNPPQPSTISAPSNPDTERLTALNEVKAPSICLQVISALGFVLSIWSLIKLVFFKNMIEQDLERIVAQYPQLQDAHFQELMHTIYGPVGIASNVFTLVISALIFWAALKMRNLQSYTFVIVATILAMLPCATNCCVWVLGLPIGIWALVVLGRKHIKSHFK